MPARDRESLIGKLPCLTGAPEGTRVLADLGVPEIGKSRLVFELSQIVEADPDLVTWRQGRCLAHGDGVTLWALGEIVKAQAGIHEADDDDAEERLDVLRVERLGL